MKKTKKDKTACVAFEDISASFDGECNLPPEQKEHIRACRICQEHLCCFRAVRNAIRSAARSMSGKKNVSVSILAGIRKKLEQPEPRRFCRRLLPVLIALLCAAAAGIVLFLRAVRDGGTDAVPQTSAGPLPPETQWNRSASSRPHSVHIFRTPELFVCTAMSLESSGEYFLVTGGETLLHPPVLFPRTVSGFCFSKSLSPDALKNSLSSLCRDLKADGCRTEQTGNRLHLKGKMRACAAAVMMKQLQLWNIPVFPAFPVCDIGFGNGDAPVFIDLHFTASERSSVLPERRGLLRQGGGERAVQNYLR